MFDIVHLLTGDDAFPPSLDSMVARYVEKRQFEFEQLAWYGHYIDPVQARDLISAYERLSEGSRLHFLLCPATYEAVIEFNKRPERDTLNIVLSMVWDEVGVREGSPVGNRPTKGSVWSPMGDEALVYSGGQYERRLLHKLESLILVDFDSPYARDVRPTSPIMFRPAEDILATEKAAVVEKLGRALAYIDEVAPTFSRIIRNYTRAIRIRKCADIEYFSSEHVTNTIGEIRILNAHLEGCDVPKLAESLVHESVHNLLSTYEYLNQHFVFSHDARQYRPVSTWTGNPIPVASFCHAVFVWFALFNLSLRELNQPNLNEGQRLDVLRRRNKYASGFLIPTPLSECIRDLAMFNATLLPTVDKLQQVVRSIVKAESNTHIPAEAMLLALA